MLEKRTKSVFYTPKSISLIAILLLSVSSHCFAQKTPIIHAPSNDPKENLILEILKLAIEKSGQGHRYTYEAYHETITERRMEEMTKDGSLTVMWAGTQRKYEEEMYPIRVPILKGLLGHRIFIIRQGDQARFDRVKTFEDLQKIPLGQGRFWGDTFVLKHANMNVVDPVKYQSLFYMLEGERFDFFPRAVHEPWSEVSSRRELRLTVEENILLIYPFAMYYFVSMDNKSFGRLIEQGFRRAIEDGSFDKLFFNHRMIKDALEFSNLKQRKIFRLANPNMSPQTPVDEKALWLNIEEDL